MPEITETKTVYVTITNTDLTEGRGYRLPLHVCVSPTTAHRLGLKKCVMGSDCPVESVEMIKLDDNKWYIDASAIYLNYPTKDDSKADEMNAKTMTAYQKAKRLGMTDDEIKSLMGN